MWRPRYASHYIMRRIKKARCVKPAAAESEGRQSRDCCSFVWRQLNCYISPHTGPYRGHRSLQSCGTCRVAAQHVVELSVIRAKCCSGWLKWTDRGLVSGTASTACYPNDLGGGGRWSVVAVVSGLQANRLPGRIFVDGWPGRVTVQRSSSLPIDRDSTLCPFVRLH